MFYVIMTSHVAVSLIEPTKIIFVLAKLLFIFNQPCFNALLPGGGILFKRNTKDDPCFGPFFFI